MSIFGERIRRPEPDIGTILSDYAKKDYVDAQDGLRVLKAGDTMSGDLTMGARSRVRGLPTSKAGPRLQGEEVVSQFETVDIVSEAFKYFLKTNKPLITIWAEEKGPLNFLEREWSFGDGASGRQPFRGYTMMAAGRVLRMGLSGAKSDSATTTAPVAGVTIMVNGESIKEYAVHKAKGFFASYSTFDPPLEVAAGNIINFISHTNSPDLAGAVVSLLIELDL